MVMILDNGANLVGFVVHYGKMERVLDGGIVRGDFGVVFWVVKDLCFSIGFGGDVAGRMAWIERISEEVGASNTSEVVLVERGIRQVEETQLK